MKITRVEALPLGVPLAEPLRWGAMIVKVKGGIIVRIHTDTELVGLGEAGLSAAYFSTVGPIITQQLGPMLIGKDPLQLGDLWEQMHGATHMWGRRGVETYALSGLDIALWDLMGKATGQPLYRLLGAHKDRVRAYFAPSLKDTRLVVAECLQGIEDGYTAFKLRVGLGLDKDREIVSEVRRAVGPTVDLMVDANMAYDRRTALHMAHVFEDLGVYWLEEPIESHSLSQYVEDHAWLAERVDLRLAGGECLMTRYEFIELMERKVFDVVQPDCTTTGGISEAKRIADMASAWNLTCVPHIACSSGTSISLAAGLHLILACGKTPLIEVDAYKGPGWEGMVSNPLVVKDGYLAAPEGPGLGVELAPEAIERFSLAGRM